MKLRLRWRELPFPHCGIWMLYRGEESYALARQNMYGCEWWVNVGKLRGRDAAYVGGRASRINEAKHAARSLVRIVRREMEGPRDRARGGAAVSLHRPWTCPICGTVQRNCAPGVTVCAGDTPHLVRLTTGPGGALSAALEDSAQITNYTRGWLWWPRQETAK